MELICALVPHLKTVLDVELSDGCGSRGLRERAGHLLEVTRILPLPCRGHLNHSKIGFIAPAGVPGTETCRGFREALHLGLS